MPNKFPLGRTLITPGALAKLSDESVRQAIARHQSGDWGEVDSADARANERALVEDARLLSVYRDSGGAKFWIITEADRSVTTVLLPEEY